MAGRKFDAERQSTVGTSMQDLELVQQDLVLAKGGALRKYAGDEDEYKLALAAHAASMWGGSAAGSAPPQESMLDALQKRQPKDAPAANRPPPPLATQHGAAKPRSATPQATPAVVAATAEPTPPTTGEVAATVDQASPPPVVVVAAAPTVSPELVIRYRDGGLVQNLVFRVQDTGGQPLFLQVLELLTTPEGTVILVVFSLAKLFNSFEHAVEQIVGQLQSIQLTATGATVILVGTRKDEVKGDAKRWTEMSTQLLKALAKSSGAAIEGLVMNSDNAGGESDARGLDCKVT